MIRLTTVVALCMITGCEEQARAPDPLDSLEMIETSEPSSAEVDTIQPRLEEIKVFGKAHGDSTGPLRVMLSFAGAPLFEQRWRPARGVLPPRLAIVLPGVDFSPALDPVLPVGAGGLARVRLGEPEPSVVFDLTRNARYQVFYLTDPHRIVVDVSASADRSKNESPVVVLDPGHGGSETGTAHRGLVESVLALDIAKRTAKRLQALLPKVRVVLTRDSDVVVSLAERTAIANALSADVFVSIHLNGGPGIVRKGGVTTFVLDVTNDEQAIRLAARENGTAPSEVTGIQQILAKLHRKSQLQASMSLAEQVQRSTLAGGRRLLRDLGDRGVKSAMFYVLVGATMPAVLIEASFLTRDEEAKALRTVVYRDALADGMARGIATYLRSL